MVQHYFFVFPSLTIIIIIIIDDIVQSDNCQEI